MLLEQLSINKCVKKSTNQSINQINVLFFMSVHSEAILDPKKKKKEHTLVYITNIPTGL